MNASLVPHSASLWHSHLYNCHYYNNASPAPLSSDEGFGSEQLWSDPTSSQQLCQVKLLLLISSPAGEKKPEIGFMLFLAPRSNFVTNAPVKHEAGSSNGHSAE